MTEPKVTISTELTTEDLHLAGGLRAGTDVSGHLMVYPTNGGKRVQFLETEKSRYVQAFRQVGLEMIGHELISISDGLVSSMWYVFDPNQKAGDPLASPLDQWSCISNTAQERSDLKIAELARSISFSLRLSALRLRNISREYHHQNTFAVQTKKEPGRKFTNVRIFDLFAEMHSFLVEMCSARDYLARFISDYVLLGLKVRTMHKLWDALRKKPISHAVADSVLVVCDEQSANGWMASLVFCGTSSFTAPQFGLSASSS
jgi:hypothetical protein